jgi:hypothetical protein
VRFVTPEPDRGPDRAAALAAVVREVEAHASAAGWDRPEQLFALVPTADLIAAQPDLVATLGLDVAGVFTPVEQDALEPGRLLEDVLGEIGWPEEVAGVAVVAERLVLPPGADQELPEDAAAAQAYAATHPDRQEVRMVAAGLRTGETACAMRLRSHDADDLVLTGPDLVPGLLTLVLASLEDEENR